jgi:hypothetical protein
VLFRQDAIFLVDTFPMRHARATAGLPRDGDALTAFRSPLASALDASHDLSFHDWKTGDALPPFDDHATGIEIHDDLHLSRSDTPDFPLD